MKNEMKNEIRISNGYLFFWGGWPSNWEPSGFEIGSSRYNCVEQYMMAEKARLFGDDEVCRKIMASDSPKGQKEFGRKVRGFFESKWLKFREKIVLDGTLAKYRQNPHLKELLMATGELEFVEASPYDRIWGIGLGIDDPLVGDRTKWRGQNLLGETITRAREIIRLESLPFDPTNKNGL